MDRASDGVFALSDAFRAFAEGTTDYQALLDTVARKVTELIGDACVVMLAREDGTWLDTGAACARDADVTGLLRDAMRAVSTASSSGLAVRVVRTGAPVLLADVSPDELAAKTQPAFAEVVRRLAIRSFLSVPLEARGRRIGALSLYRYGIGRKPFDERDRAFASSIGSHAALAISNAQLFESLQGELRERRRAEEEAKTFAALVENSTNMIAIAGFDGYVLYCNAAGRALVGVDPDADVRTLRLADYLTEDGHARMAIVRERGSWQGQGTVRNHKTREIIPAQISSFVARAADGQPIGVATVLHDLRETKRLEAELRQSQKMEALGRLAGGIAHDFNNLLTVILSYSSMLARSLPPTSRDAKDVEQIERAGQRAADLTRQLLAFGRRQVLEPKPLELGATLRGMESMIRRLIGEDIELRIQTCPKAAPVVADAGQIEQVVMNLVVNARDAMHGGGVLTLETAREDVPPARAPELGLRPGTYSTLAVTDTGVGIPEDAKPHLFEPFFTTKDRAKGTGLGLSTAMGIVQQSGGSIAVDSRPGLTTFRVYLPATDRPTPEPPPAPRTITQRRNTGRILVVEDEHEVRVLVRDVLRAAGYDVLDAADGEQALALAAASAHKFDLLVTDVIMPKMSGRQLAERFLALHPDTCVLYMSGYTDDKLGHHGVLDRDIALLQKPLTPDVLLRRVRDMLK